MQCNTLDTHWLLKISHMNFCIDVPTGTAWESPLHASQEQRGPHGMVSLAWSCGDTFFQPEWFFDYHHYCRAVAFRPCGCPLENHLFKNTLFSTSSASLALHVHTVCTRPFWPRCSTLDQSCPHMHTHAHPYTLHAHITHPHTSHAHTTHPHTSHAHIHSCIHTHSPIRLTALAKACYHSAGQINLYHSGIYLNNSWTWCENTFTFNVEFVL